MAESVIGIWNLALLAAGGRGSVSSETDKGREPDLCRLWYPLVRDSILKAASWPCSRAYSRLGLLSTRSSAEALWTPADPSPTWLYAYAQPTDMLAPRYLTTYARFDRAKFNGSPCIMTNEAQAILHYSAREDDVTNWDTGLENAVIHGLASAITMPLTGKRTLARDNREAANETILLAQTEIANESDDHFEALPSWVQARGYDQLPVATKFFWPYTSFAIGSS